MAMPWHYLINGQVTQSELGVHQEQEKSYKVSFHVYLVSNKGRPTSKR
jgi:hypothetical protein